MEVERPIFEHFRFCGDRMTLACRYGGHGIDVRVVDGPYA
jgi:hypothetical protein